MKLTQEELKKHISKNLQSLKLSRFRIRDSDIPLVCRFLESNNCISMLNLESNFIGDVGARTMASNTSLTILNLCGNKIDNDGAKALALNTTLMSLNVRGNAITLAGAKELVQNTRLTALDLSQNSNGYEGVKALDFLKVLKSNKSLIELKSEFGYYDDIYETINKILSRNKARPWLMTIKNARLLAQGQRTKYCPLGILPIEVLGIINNYAVSGNYFSFFIHQFNKRPTAEDIDVIKRKILS